MSNNEICSHFSVCSLCFYTFLEIDKREKQEYASDISRIEKCIGQLIFFVNLLHWNESLHVENLLPQNCNNSSVLSITQARQIINWLLFNNFYPVMSYQRVEEESDESYTVLVTRYGPQSVASATWSILLSKKREIK